RVGAAVLAGVPEDQGIPALGIEARDRLHVRQRHRRIRDRAGPARPGEVLAPLTDGERLTRPVGDLGDSHRTVAKEESLTVVATGRIVGGTEGVETGNVALAERADVVRRRQVADRVA